MDILELGLAAALWLLFMFLGWRKKAARRTAQSSEPDRREVETEGEAEPGRRREAGRMPVDFRDLIRQLRDGWLPPDESEERPPPVRSAAVETPPAAASEEVLEVESVPPTSLAEQPRRRSPLARSVLRDLTSGRASLARAMLLREVLGPPVALRGSDSTGRAEVER